MLLRKKKTRINGLRENDQIQPSALPFDANSQIEFLYFQICVFSHMCFVTVYSILGYWNYPLKNIFGVTGCHIANLLGETGTLQIQLHSFIMATTRYIFLFHDNLLLKFSLTTNVRAIICAVRGVQGCSGSRSDSLLTLQNSDFQSQFFLSLKLSEFHERI